jgi:NAD(P)H-flavin reductase
MVLVWGMRKTSDFYALDALRALAARAPHLRVILAAQELSEFASDNAQIQVVKGSALDALNLDVSLPGRRDVYVAGPPTMLREVARAMEVHGVGAARLSMDSFGV